MTQQAFLRGAVAQSLVESASNPCSDPRMATQPAERARAQRVLGKAPVKTMNSKVGTLLLMPGIIDT
jgi:hypothetical protein